MTRCLCTVFDNNSNKQRKCKKNVWIYGMCWAHNNKYLAPFALKIQTIWRSYRTRTKINLFNKLPKELWNIVLYYSKLEHNVNNLYKSYRKIYINRNILLNLTLENEFNAIKYLKLKSLLNKQDQYINYYNSLIY